MSKRHKKHKKHDRISTSEDGAGGAVAPTSDVASPSYRSLSREEYEAQLHLLQGELVKLQRQFIRFQDRILAVLEGRDAAGKDGSIKRIVEYLSPRETRVMALGKPSDSERSGWRFQRRLPHLPPWPRNSYCSTAVGTTEEALSTSWASAPRSSKKSSCNRCRSSRRGRSARASSG